MFNESFIGTLIVSVNACDLRGGTRLSRPVGALLPVVACGQRSSQAAKLGGMHDDGDLRQHSRAAQSACATLRPAGSQQFVPVAVLELAHGNFDCALEVTPIGGVTQLSCATEA